MKLEDQVCRIELAKKLKELGVEQKSLWCWISKYEYSNMVETQEPKLFEWYLNGEPDHTDEITYSAYTVAELGDLSSCHFISQKEMTGGWKCLQRKAVPDDSNVFFASTEANVRARTLVYLLENKLLDNE